MSISLQSSPLNYHSRLLRSAAAVERRLSEPSVVHVVPGPRVEPVVGVFIRGFVHCVRCVRVFILVLFRFQSSFALSLGVYLRGDSLFLGGYSQPYQRLAEVV